MSTTTAAGGDRAYRDGPGHISTEEIRMKSLVFALAVASALTATTFAADAKPKAGASPESVECSKQADAKGLHGKERKTFRAACKKELKAKASSTPAGTPATPKAGTPAPAAK